jgi:tripartite-type tricarboxylate transporter receptor subunit TctC
MRKTISLAVTLLLGGMSMAYAQNFPVRPVRILTTEPGASSDLAARVIALGLTARLGQQVIVDNRGGVLAIDALVKAQPDGYTLLLYGSGLWLAPLAQEHPTYDPVKDVTPVSIATSSPAVLVVNPQVPAKSVKELIAVAKAKPGTLNYSSGGPGSTPHLAAELLNSMAGIKITRVPYKATGPAVNAVIGGEVQVLFATTGSVGPHVKSGKLRALAVTSAKPTALVPDLPTVASTVPGYELTQVQGMFVPAKTPTPLINRLYHEIAAVLSQPEVKERFIANGAEAVGSSPDVLAAQIKREMSRLGPFMHQAEQ